FHYVCSDYVNEFWELIIISHPFLGNLMNVYDSCVYKLMSLTNSWEPIRWRIPRVTPVLLIKNTLNRSSTKDFPVCPSLELCPSDWLYFQRKCYYLSESEASWNSSQSFCSLHNASLLVIENQQELSFMVKITKQDPWIGLYKRNEDFFWVNGKPLDNELGYLISETAASHPGAAASRSW
uniref:C-type lectin domain-containing protein n=1 Tax=Otus sunia TaxID=257818 RepID=A0A8C8ALA3_9STRI